MALLIFNQMELIKCLCKVHWNFLMRSCVYWPCYCQQRELLMTGFTFLLHLHIYFWMLVSNLWKNSPLTVLDPYLFKLNCLYAKAIDTDTMKIILNKCFYPLLLISFCFYFFNCRDNLSGGRKLILVQQNNEMHYFFHLIILACFSISMFKNTQFLLTHKKLHIDEVPHHQH